MPIDRTALNATTDDSGGGTNGTIINKAFIGSVIMDAIDAMYADDVILTASKVIRRNTSDGSDSGFVGIAGGGAQANTRGASILAYGNEHATLPGIIRVLLGNIAGSKLSIENAAGAAALEVSNAGIVSLPLGALLFPSSQVASSNANTLDDYEEGTFTPVGGGSGGTSGQTYTTQSGTYVKIGRLVLAWGKLVYSVKGTITSNFQFQGLPFTAGAESALVVVGYFNALNANRMSINGFVSSGATAISAYGITAAAAGMASLSTSDIGATSELTFATAYFSNS